jgi:diguanylate cyclase (GGDEF)-like protein/PAS domain S-box-containing protein
MATKETESTSQLYRALVENAAELMVLLDMDGRIRLANRASEEVLGYKPEEIVGHHYSDFVGERQVKPAWQAFAQITAGRSRRWSELPVRHREGRTVYVDASARPVRNSAGRIEAVAGTASDVTEPRLARERLDALAHEDDLTGLSNRRFFLEVMKQHLSGAVPNGTRGAILMLDVDGLKSVNDLHGHEAGDRFIIEMAARLARSVRAGEYLARLRGDEFAVLMPRAEPDDVVRMADRLLRVIAREEFDIGEGLRATASVGAYMMPSGESVDAALRRADGALYEAKRRGGNRAVLA